MACQKISKQGSVDIIVKVNLQSAIPTSFYTTVANSCENNEGMRVCMFTFNIISTLPCLHTFGMPSLHVLTHFYFLYKVLNKEVSLDQLFIQMLHNSTNDLLVL